MTDFKNAEILAPVGNKEMLVAAVRSGADAVYLGAQEFSARRNAENFSPEELKEAIEYCHITNVRVYLTLNILIKENELEEAFLLARNVYNMGIDGIIIQDLGLAKVLSEKIPDLKLHASTQMSVHSPAALPILKSLGFCQVVAAREMSRKELIALCKEASSLGITVEAFVHGALCMSVSGQCLLSAFLGSRSGNRGLCAGPCRLPFKVKNGTGYDLSLKDLSLIDHLCDLYEIGVRSFKIEGRMKRPEYVAAATAACRYVIDNGFADENLNNTLKNVFSRSGFTAGYYEENTGKDMFGIRTKEDVLAADKAFPALHEIYRFERKNVGIDITAEILEGKPVSLTFSDGENRVTASGNIPQKAQNRAIDYETAKKSLLKLGDTPYFAKNTEVTVSEGLFVSAGELNDLRRSACSLLDKKRAENGVKNCDALFCLTKTANPQSPDLKICIRVEKVNQIPEVTDGISAIILPIEQDFSIISKYNIPFIADIPRGITNQEKLLTRLVEFKKQGGKAALCGNLAAVTLVNKAGLAPLADTGLNILNSESLCAAQSFSVKAAVISAEETAANISALNGDIPKGIIAYGNIPLMLFRNCPLKNGISCKECDKNGVITDRLGVEFPIRCRGTYSEMLNSVPLWLCDRMADFKGIDFAVLYFTRETEERVSQVINAFKLGLSPDVKHTRGLYYRGTV